VYASVKNQYIMYKYIISYIYRYIGASRPSPSSEIGRHNIITTGDFQSSIGSNNNNALSVPHEPIILYTHTQVGRWKMDKPLTGCYGNQWRGGGLGGYSSDLFNALKRIYIMVSFII